MTVIECTTCSRWFRDFDGTRTCPAGHENPATDDDEAAHTDHLKKVTW